MFDGDPGLIKVSVKKNRDAGTGRYKVKIKGKQYKALNKLLNSRQSKKDYKVESLDSAAKTVVISGSGNTVGTANVKL